MDIRSPVQNRPLLIGPLFGEQLQREINAREAAAAMRCLSAQLVMIAAVVSSAGIFGWMLWTQLSKYDQLLKYCAGV